GELVHDRPRHRPVGGRHRGVHRAERGLAVHASRRIQGVGVGGQLPTFVDELIGHQVLVVDHRFEPVDQPLPRGVLDEFLQQPDALAGAGAEDVGADAADGHQPINAVGAVGGEVDADGAAHRVADDVHLVDTERVQKRRYGTECGDHRVAAEVVADPEAGEFEDQAPEVGGEGGQNSAEVAPSGDAGARAVQEQQYRTRIGAAAVVVAQSAPLSGDFTQVVFGQHDLV